MSIVSLQKTDNYLPENLFQLITESIENSGFDLSLLKGATIAVKPNLLTAATPESGVTTHPEFFHGVIKVIKEYKGNPVLVESPAFFSLNHVLRKCGYADIIKNEKILIGDTSKTSVIRNENGKKYKSFHVAEAVVNADFIFNLPKMKTHSLTYFTGAVKNLFGTIHGLEKSKWHVKTETEKDFISFLLDFYGAFLNTKCNRIISIMDGIVGLQGEGPGKSGSPVLSRAIIAGTDAVSVDSVAIRISGLELSRSTLTIEAENRELGVSNPGKIKIIGCSPDEFSNSFIPPKTGSFLNGFPLNTHLLKNIVVKKPVPDSEKCTLCYQCRTICPAGVISKSKNGYIPFYNYSKCIRCYCCMEICPEGAIDLKRRFF